MKKLVPVAIAAAVLTACAVVFFAQNGYDKQSKSKTESPKATQAFKIEDNVGTESKKEKKPGGKDKKSGDKEKKTKKGKLLNFSFMDFFKKLTLEKADNGEKATLLIYMIGSDLESRSSAGTAELEEIEKSGIDLAKANVIVYAGGSQKWHNDAVTEGKNVILKLERGGFEAVEETEAVNMGEPDSLSYFLKYAYDHYPSKSYSLIMWDHGNGPIIGYGKDMLFDNDSLTLSEMKKALSASPFSGGNKLEWVGFDACLMSSAELVCTWDDYAKYLVASQEIEPSFGWNYGFLENFGKADTVTLLKSIVDSYLNGCNEYYEKKGYKNRDTTLALIDLSQAGGLEAALNSLFARADKDVNEKYNSLVVKRVETRALGRASTGSEYDLIDLYDMAEQLKEVYPDETQKLRDAINKAVVKNGTNTQGLSGISLYYPFYNKYYYEKSWDEAYCEIGLFADYQSYLDKYEKIWLKDDKLEKYASSLTPEKGDSRSGFGTQEYTLRLTKEQNESFAEAKFYILKKVGDEMYCLMSTSNDVVNDNGILKARFNGKGIYVKDKYNDYALPNSKIYDKVGDTTRYSMVAARSENGIPKAECRYFLLSLDGITEQVDIISIKADNGSEEQDFLGSGKSEEVSMYDFSELGFFYFDYAYLQRHDNGTIRPFKEWPISGAASMARYFVNDGIEFEYSSIDDGEYYLMFEITDTQNNKYCSELLDIDVKYGDKKPAYKPEDINLTWESGDKLKIYEAEGTELYLKKGKSSWGNKPEYKLEAQNETDYDLSYRISDLIINDGVYIERGGSCSVGTKEKDDGYFFILLSDQIKFGGIDEVYRMSFTLEAYSYKAGRTLVRNQRINIDIEDGARIKNLQEFYGMPELKEDFLGAHAGKQVLFESTDLKITLLKFGKEKDYSSYGDGIVCIENMSATETAEVSLSAVAVNGITIYDSSSTVKVLPGCKIYEDFSISEYTLAEDFISAVENLKIAVGIWKNTTWLSGTVDMHWMPIELERAGKETFFPAESKDVIFDKNGVKILLDGFESYKSQWNVTIINDSDFDICIRSDARFHSPISIYGGKVGAHQRRNAQIQTGDVESKEKTFDIVVTDFHETKVLFDGDAPITLCRVDEEKREDINLAWESGDSLCVYEGENYSVFLKKVEDYGKPQYVFAIDNRNPFETRAEIKDIVINGDTYCGSDYINASANEQKTNMSGLLDKRYTTGVIDEVKSISFTFNCKGEYKLIKDVKDQKISVLLSDEVSAKGLKEIYKQQDLDLPFLGAFAKEQVLYENDDVIIRLLGLGGYEHQVKFIDGTEAVESSYEYRICIENLSDEKKTVELFGRAINDITVDNHSSYDIPAGCKLYETESLAYSYDHEKITWFSFENGYNINDINSFKLAFVSGKVETAETEETAGNIVWLPVKLESASENIYEFDESGEIIFDEFGVKVLLDSYTEEKEKSIWNITVINDSDYDMMLWLSNNDLTRRAVEVSSPRVGARQRKKMQIEPNTYGFVEEITFKVNIKDFFNKKILYSSDELITLKAK